MFISYSQVAKLFDRPSYIGMLPLVEMEKTAFCLKSVVSINQFGFNMDHLYGALNIKFLQRKISSNSFDFCNFFEKELFVRGRSNFFLKFSRFVGVWCQQIDTLKSVSLFEEKSCKALEKFQFWSYGNFLVKNNSYLMYLDEFSGLLFPSPEIFANKLGNM